MVNWLILIICELIVFFFSFIGSIFTRKNTRSGWYEDIKPSITPPGYVFPIVWTILYFLIGLSLYFAWVNSGRLIVAIIFAINLFFNTLWSYLFFYKKNVKAGFVDILLIWISIFVIIIILWNVSYVSSLLLLPYLLWVSFASVLNYLAMKRIKS